MAPEPVTLSAILTAVLTAIVGMVVQIIITPIRWVWGIGRQMFVGVLSMIAMSMFHAMVYFSPDEAIRMMQFVTNTYFTPSEEWAGFVSAYMQRLTGQDIDIDDIIGEGIGVGSKSSMEALGQAFLHPMLNLIMPGAEGPVREAGIRPQDGVDAAERFLATNLQFQLSAWLLHMIGDTASFGMWKAMKDLPNAISWSFGIGWLSWLVMGAPFKIGIADPLTEYYNRMYRPTRLSLARLADAHNMGLVSPEVAVDRLRAMGWPEELIPIVLDLERKKLTKAEAKALHKSGFLNFEQYKAVYAQMQYTPEEADALATLESLEDAHKLVDKIADEAFDLYVDEMLDASTLRRYLTEANKTSEEIELYLALAELKRIKPPTSARVEKKVSPANIGNLYKRNKIPQTEAIILWLDSNVPRNQLKYWLLLYEPPEPPEPTPRELTTGVIGRLYKDAEIDVDEASLLWERLDWDPKNIGYLFKYYRREE